MTSIRLDITLPPSLNNAYFNMLGRGRVPTAKYKAWRTAAGWEVNLANPPSLKCPYRLTLMLPEKVRGDIDNRTKAVSDLLVDFRVIPDDRHAVSVHAERSADIAPGRCRILVEAAA